MSVSEIDFEAIQNRSDRIDSEIIKYARNAHLFRDFAVEMAKVGAIDPYHISVPSGYAAYINVSVYKDYDSNGKYVHEFDVDASKKAITEFFNAARKIVGNANVTKDYRYDEFRVTVKLHEDFDVYCNVAREAVCTKKVVKKEWVEPRVIEGHYEEEIEWDCNTPSLLAVEVEA